KIMEVTGPFALGFDEDGLYRPARDLLRTAVCRSDASRLGQRAGELALAEVAEAAGRSGMDLVGDLLEPLLTQLIAEYVGLDRADWRSVVRWTQTIFTEIFISATPFVRPAAMAVAQEM